MHKVTALRFLIAWTVGCGSGAGSQPTGAPAGGPALPVPSAVPAVLTRVGAHPRGFAQLAGTAPQVRDELSRAMTGLVRRSLADCAVDLSRLSQIRIAVGEPLRVAAEVDGAIDARAVGCLLGTGDDVPPALREVVVRDRPGGVAIELRAEATQAAGALALAAELAQRCQVGSCGAATLGPAGRPLRVDVRLDKRTHLELGGPALGHGAAAVAAAFDQLRAAIPGLKDVTATDQHGTLVAELPTDDVITSVAFAFAVRANLLTAYRIPSPSMAPTLLVEDHLFAAKGALAGAPQPGDILVYTAADGQTYVKRYLAGPGQVIAETADGISIDGKPLATEVVERDYHYTTRDDDGRWVTGTGIVVREHLGTRSYLTLRDGAPRSTGTWTVPDGHVFMVGDNRNNSMDSRAKGAVDLHDIVGHAVGLWLAHRDGGLDWERMGVPLD